MAERELGPGRRRALVVVTGRPESTFTPEYDLKTRDAGGLAEVLSDPDVGAFDVNTLVNHPYEASIGELTRFFSEADDDDLLILFLSGDAIRSVGNEVMFGTIDATEDLSSGWIGSTALRTAMDVSPARRIVVFLDLRILPNGLETAMTGSMPIATPFEGRHRVIISMGRPLGDSGHIGLGKALSDGLATGRADTNGDGLVDVDELFAYLGEQYRRTLGPPPEMSAVNVADRVIIARAPGWQRGIFDPITDPIGEGSKLPPEQDRPPEAFDAAPIAATDYWTIRDELGYAAYAEAIAAFVQHDETRPPLTIGIKAPWGAGKTSLMRMVQQELDPAWGGERATIRLTPRSKERLGTDPSARLEPVTVGAVLKEFKETGGAVPEDLRAEPEQTTQLVDADDWRPTVWFNPWMYQSGEQVWAGFAHEVITQITGRMPRGERERFWLALNKARVDEDAVRRKVYTLLFQRLVPSLLALAALVVVALVLVAVDAVVGFADVLQDALGGALGIGGVGAVVWGAIRSAGVRAESATGSLDRLVRPPTYDVKLDDLVDEPGYQQRLGFLYLVQTDIRRVLDLVATPERPLVVFVDDLDRCSPGTVAQVIEAINLFLAGEFPNCVFVLAMEPEVVAAHIEVAHRPLVAMLKQRGLDEGAGTLGWRFLEKIVQLPLNLPPPGKPRVGTFLGSFLASGTPGDDPALRPPVVPSEASTATPKQAEPASAAGAQTQTGDVPAPPPPPVPEPARAERRALRKELGRRLRHDSPEVLEIVGAVAGHLAGNPREIKRFVNVFRFYAFIQQERERSGQSERVELLQVAKLALLAIRWPHLRGILGGPVRQGEETTVLAQLVTSLHANGAQPPRTLAEQLGDAGVRQTVRQTLVESGDLCAFLRQEPRLDAAVAELL